MKGTKKQKEALKHLTNKESKIIIYGGAAGGGKSFLGCFWLAVMAISYPGTRFFIGREELKRIRQSTLISWHKVTDLIGFKDYTTNFQDNYIKLGNGSQIDLLDLAYLPRDPLYERFGSLEYTGGWIEEAGEVNFGAFDVLRTRTGRHLNDKYDILSKVLITCNPKKNWLYTDFYKPYKDNSLPNEVKFIQAFIMDNPHLSDDYRQNLLNTKDKAKKERLLYGNWEYSEDPSQLIEFEKIKDLWNNNFIKQGQKYISADIALHGSDKFVIVVWSGWRVIDIITHSKTDGKEVIQAIQKAAYTHQVPNSNIVYDSDGLGGFVGGWINNAKAFKNGGSPIKTKDGVEYQNLKSQCYFEYAKKVQSNQVYIQPVKFQAEIIEEHEQIKNNSIDSDNKLKVIPKDKVKEIIGRSPDFTDALMMRVFFDLKPDYTNFMSRG